MRKIIYFILFIPFLAVGQPSSPSHIDYTFYHLYFEDDFEGYSLPSDTYPSFAFQSHSDFIAKYTLTSGTWGARNEYYYPEMVSMPSYGTIRLSEIDMPTPFDVSTTTGIRHCTKKSGILNSTAYYGYGIYEARIKLPRDYHLDEHAQKVMDDQPAEGAFWTDLGEIDVIDNTTAHKIHSRLISWEYSPNPNKSIDLSVDNAHHFISDTREFYDLSDDFHTFSCKWTPSSAHFYLDSIFYGQINFNDGEARTPSSFRPMQIALLAWTGSYNLQNLDIDWIKFWKQDCIDDEAEIHGGYSLGYTDKTVSPQLEKWRKITVSSPDLVHTVENAATIYVANATTIEQNFLADESLYHPQSATNLHPANGFFEIIFQDCASEYFAYMRPNSNESVVSDNDKKFTAVGQHAFAGNDYNAISDNREKNTLAPNPAGSTFTITYLCSQSGTLEISVKDVSGRIKHTESVTCISGGMMQQTVNINDYTPGVYFVEMVMNGERTVKKLIKL